MVRAEEPAGLTPESGNGLEQDWSGSSRGKRLRVLGADRRACWEGITTWPGTQLQQPGLVTALHKSDLQCSQYLALHWIHSELWPNSDISVGVKHEVHPD